MGNGTEAPVTTPPFVPGEIPGLDTGRMGVAVPGATSGAPPAGGVPGVPGAPQADATQQFIQNLMKVAQQRTVSPIKQPPVPGRGPQSDPMQAGMGTEWPHAWSGVRFAGAVGGLVSTAIAAKKRQQLQQAEADWTTMQSYMNEKLQAEQSKDPEAIAAASKKLDDWVMADNKRMKNMGKALNQDYLNPEKTTVYGEALKRVAASSDQKEKSKAQAATGIKGMVMKLLGQKQQLQMTLDEKERMAHEIESKVPTTQGTLDPKTMIELQRVLGEEAYRKELAAGRKQEHEETLAERKQEHEEALSQRKAEHIDNMQFRYQQLGAQIQEKTDALSEKKLEAKDRMALQESLLGLKRDQLDQQRMLAEEKLGLAGTPKERQTWVNNELKELMKSRDEAQKGKHFFGLWGGKAYDDASDRVMRLQGMSEDIISGKIDTEKAIETIYALEGQKIPPGWVHKNDGPQGPGWYPPGK